MDEKELAKELYGVDNDCEYTPKVSGTKPYTVSQLLEAFQEAVNKGYGDYTVMLSDDDEGNSFHYCWYTLATPAEISEGDEYEQDAAYYASFINTHIAPMDKTILLG